MKNKTLYLKIFLTLGLVAYLIHSIGFVTFSQTIIRGDMRYFFLAFSIVPAFIVIKTYKWHLMVRGADAREGFTTSLNAVLTGLGFGVFTPARAGEIMRVHFYKNAERVMLGGLVVADRLIDLITILVLGMYFAALQIGLIGVLFFALIICVIIIALLQIHNLSKVLFLLPKKMRYAGLVTFLEKIETSSRVLTPGALIRFAGLSFLNWFFTIIQFYLLLNMYFSCTFDVAFVSLPIIQLSNLIPLTIAGIGVRENLSVFVMKAFNVPGQVAAIGAFSLYVLNIFLPGMAGLLLFGLQKKTQK